MLEIHIPDTEITERLDDSTSRIVKVKSTTVRLEHSLYSLSKWEARYERSFLSDPPKNTDEILYYCQCMIVNNADPMSVYGFREDDIRSIQEYLSSKQTATTIHDLNKNRPKQRKTITSEVIYYWMFIRGIPMECDRWFLNRLLTLIRVFDIEQSSGDKHNRMNRKDSAKWMKGENARRRAMMHSKG